MFKSRSKAPSTHDWLRRWPMAIWMTIVWVLLWGDLTIANVLTGVLVSFVLLRVMPMPRVGFEGRISLIGILSLLLRLIADIVAASAQVAYQALRFGRQPRGAVIRVKLASSSDLVLTLTAELTVIVPGSIVVEAHRLTGMLYVHLLDAHAPGAVEKARQTVLAQEKRVMYALSSDADIADAGYPARPWKRRRAKNPEVSR